MTKLEKKAQNNKNTNLILFYSYSNIHAILNHENQVPPDNSVNTEEIR